MDLPVEFLTLSEMLSLSTMATIVFAVVQATKELKYLRDVPTILWAWVVSFALLFAGSWIEAGAVTAELLYMSFANSILAAAAAVGLHQTLKKARVVDVLKGPDV